ncbi:tetratricopeptide repeat protein [Candidatus Omnitrophota bacterium]
MKDFLPGFVISCICILFMFFIGIEGIHAGELSDEAASYREEGFKAQEKGNIDKAVSWYQKACDLDRNYAAPHNDLGILFEAKGLSDRAEVAYKKALGIDPNYVKAHTNLALLYERKGELEKAAFHWMRRYRLGKSGDPWTMEAKHRLEKIGLLDKAKRGKIKKGKSKGPEGKIKKRRSRQKDPKGWQRLGSELEREGQRTNKGTTKQTSIREGDSDSELRSSISLAEKRLREEKSKKRNKGKLPGEESKLSSKGKSATYLEARNYYKRGEYSRALDVIRSSKKKSPKQDYTLLELERNIKNKIKEERIEDHYNEGLMRYRQKNFAGARKEFEAILNILPE